MIKLVDFLKKYFGALYVPIIWSLIVGVLCCLPGSMLPSEAGFKIPNFDKIVHIGMFGGFVFLWNLYLSSRIPDLRKLLRLFFLFYVLGNIYGIGMEYVQKYWIPGRDYDLADMIADMIGAGLAYGLSNIWFVRSGKK
jgi:hypothetical protein